MERCGLDGEPLVETDEDPLIGRTIDRYRITGVLGGGAMGQVYAAEHEFLGSEHAVKILWGELACVQTVAKRFRREAKALSTLSDERIVAVTDFGTTDAGITFLVMDRLRGCPLSDVIAEAPLEPNRVRDIASQIAGALAVAHDGGFVHRDLKPANVMILAGDKVKLLDFGIAKNIAAEDSDELTAAGVVIGTPAYMAPEQIEQKTVGPAADLYSLGVIMFAMLTGERPFTGTPQQILLKQIAEDAPELPHADGLGPVAQRLLQKAPEDRYRSAAEVMSAVEGPLDGAPMPRRSRWRAMSLVIAASMAVGALAFFLRPPTDVPTAPLEVIAEIEAPSVPPPPISPKPLESPPIVDERPAPTKKPSVRRRKKRPARRRDSKPAPARLAAPKPTVAPPSAEVPPSTDAPANAPSPAMCREMLEAVSARLGRASDVLPKAELVAFEDRYLSLSLSLTDTMTGEETRDLYVSATRLADALAQAIEANR